ncbi:MAG: hypothetical protein P4L59_17990 [Desulfosporosinus sp.]|nr:hypothetical protein [Desulfosporosinus sp.]
MLSDDLPKLANDIRAMHAIVLVGAGASIQAGIPLTNQLYPIMWNTLDQNVESRRAVAKKLNCSDAQGKSLIGDNWDRMMTAFSVVAENNIARLMFQKAFSDFDCGKTSFSHVYTALAQLLHSGYIEMVISLNWDTQLEKAWRALYGTEINSERTQLYKPHGDAKNPLSVWTFPNQAGTLDESVLQEVDTKNQIFSKVFCLIGYSERDNLIVRNLINPLENKCRVYRVSPNATGEGSIQCCAEEILPKLAKLLCTDDAINYFDQITFNIQRGLEAAIAGERLGVSDVLACPRLPQAELAKKRLDVLHFVSISGSAGCGKSITSYQIAYDYMKSGWEVLRLKEDQPISNDILFALANLKHKTVIIIEDAHLLASQQIRLLKERTYDRLKIIVSKTELINDLSNDIRISNLQSVQTIRDYYLEHNQEVQQIVINYDSHIGDAYLDEKIEDRINVAAKEDNPWLFNFVLRGGWNQTKHEISVLRDLNRADYLYIILAACQIAGLDASVSVAKLYEYANIFNKDNQWAVASIEYLKKRKLILIEPGVRCLHIRCASFAIIYYIKNADKDDHNNLINLLKAIIIKKDTPLLGISWLLNTQDVNWYGLRLLDDEVWTVLVARCLSATESVERRDAAFVLNTIARYRKQVNLEPFFDKIAEIINEIDGNSAYAFGNYINDIYNGSKELFENLIKKINPRIIGLRFNDSTTNEWYSWGHFLNRLHLSKNALWKKELLSAIDDKRIEYLIKNATIEDTSVLGEFVTAITLLNRELGYRLFELSMNIFCEAFRQTPLKTWQEIEHEIVWLVLGYSMFANRKPNVKQKKYAKQIVNALSDDQVAYDLSHAVRREWEPYVHFLYWVFIVDKNKYARIVSKIDLSLLEKTSLGLWKRPPRELRLLVMCLSAYGALSKSWIESHESEIKTIDPLIGRVAPQVALNVFARNGYVDFCGHNEHDWNSAQELIYRLNRLDISATSAIIKQNIPKIVNYINNLQEIDCEKNQLLNFLETISDIDQNLISIIFASLNMVECNKSWSRATQSKKKIVIRTVNKLIELSEQFCGNCNGLRSVQ